MKKLLSLLLAAVLITGCLTACRTSGPAGSNDRIRIVTTIFPEYDWLMNILGENPAEAEVTLLLDNGIDMHSFQASAEDILTISSCDLFIYVGGTSDAWVEDALKEAPETGRIDLDLLELLEGSAKEEETVEGMQAEEEEETEYDEHIWLSLKNAAILVDRIEEALETIDPDHAQTYQANRDAYQEKLARLDQAYQDTVSEASITTLLFGDRFPFRYLVDDYGLSYYAAFPGCSAETEASFETIAFLSQKVDELSLPAVVTIEGGDHRIAETIVQNTQTKDQKILTLDSMQSITAKEIEDHTTYLSIMEKNLEVLKEALHR